MDDAPTRAHSTLAEAVASVDPDAPDAPACDLPEALMRRRGYDID